MKLNCLIIDDEPVARKGLEEYVSEVDFLNLAGKCENAMKASALLNDGNVDLLFLDIHMPKLSGIEFLKTLKNPPLVIFTTAYSEYALEGYSLDIIDYLVKPIPFDRFLKAVQKAHDFYVLKQKAEASPSPSQDYFFIKCDHKFEKVKYGDVLYIEAMQNYCIIHTAERKMITYITFSGLESQLPTDRFLKVHKSFMVALDKITAVDSHDIVIGNSRIPVSRNLKDDVMQKIMGNNLFKRS
ncbi:MAG TPA: LytTR family DNA-binding domain-containing protein [Cyclobacteriaceae bacterium]|nr:LytTR family DNA-binding domain-containing protein [Cyclobacteriaceae bacterium]HRJ80665.1 LytTR family DNA-binding domain-containing protein [Cyclobacteriaceae bacterium]